MSAAIEPRARRRPRSPKASALTLHLKRAREHERRAERGAGAPLSGDYAWVKASDGGSMLVPIAQPSIGPECLEDGPEEKADQVANRFIVYEVLVPFAASIITGSTKRGSISLEGVGRQLIAFCKTHCPSVLGDKSIRQIAVETEDDKMNLSRAIGSMQRALQEAKISGEDRGRIAAEIPRRLPLLLGAKP